MIILNVCIILGVAAILLMLLSIKEDIRVRNTDLLDKEREERQMLLDRIMARDLHEYNFVKEQKPAAQKKSNNNFLKEAQEQAFRNMNHDNIGGDE